jgi:hypothetical protein
MRGKKFSSRLTTTAGTFAKGITRTQSEGMNKKKKKKKTEVREKRISGADVITDF